jgi:hypothetical protein
MEGRALLESLKLAGIPCSHNLVIDRDTLKYSLSSKLSQECQSRGKFPLLHLSMHGNENGIALSNGDFVDWQELWELLIPISNTMQGGLLICMSTCFGSYGAYMAAFAENNMTYGALIGNSHTTEWTDAAVGYITFYHQYFKGLSPKDCVEIMKISSGDNRFELYWGKLIQWKIKELTFAANMFR